MSDERTILDYLEDISKLEDGVRFETLLAATSWRFVSVPADQLVSFS